MAGREALAHPGPMVADQADGRHGGDRPSSFGRPTGLRRIRWQLTLSHLIAIAFTLVLMIATTVIISSAWVARQNSPSREPAHDARTIATAISGMAATGSRSELDGVLRALVNGDLRLQTGPGPMAADPSRFEGVAPSLRDLKYAVAFDATGDLLASSIPAGASANGGDGAWQTLHRLAMSGERNPDRLVQQSQDGQSLLLGAWPIVGPSGRSIGTVVVAKSAQAQPDRATAIHRVLAIFSAATILVLAASFLFALASASLVGYFLSRRLTVRLEWLGRAAEGLASGDLALRVREGPPDEVGQLARRFNHMARRLDTTVGELETQRQAAEEALRAKRDLVANVSHELRTPLSSIRGHTESLLMESQLEDPRQREYLDVIHRESERLSVLIDDLFLLSTTEAGALTLVVHDLDPTELLAEAIRDAQALAQRDRRVSVVSRVPDSLPRVRGDRQRVLQVMANLLRNALRYTPEGGLISVAAVVRGGALEVSVEDTGPGIPAEELPHVFERFFRVDEARDRSSGGAGLGLAIVRELVEAMDGEVGVSSQPGEGSRFSFTLPLAGRAHANESPAEPQNLTQS